MAEKMNQRAKRSMLKEAAQDGRKGDNTLAHMTKGEIVIPKALAEQPEVRKMLEALYKEAGVDIDQFTVGHKKNSINPETGYPEFGFFSKVVNVVKKVAGTAIGAGIGFAVGGPAGAATGAKIGAGVDVARYSAEQAQDLQDEAQAEARRAQEEALAYQERLAAEQKAQFEADLAARQAAAEEQRKAYEQMAAAQSAQAEAARAALEQQAKQYAEQKAESERKAAELQAQIDDERRAMGEREASRLKARRSSGRRSLISTARLSPELGLGNKQASLGGAMA